MKLDIRNRVISLILYFSENATKERCGEVLVLKLIVKKIVLKKTLKRDLFQKTAKGRTSHPPLVPINGNCTTFVGLSLALSDCQSGNATQK